MTENKSAPTPPANDAGTPRTRTQELIDGIAQAINRGGGENGSNTPDFILAEYLVRCLKAFDMAFRTREKWYGGADSQPTSADAPTNAIRRAKTLTEWEPTEHEREIAAKARLEEHKEWCYRCLNYHDAPWEFTGPCERRVQLEREAPSQGSGQRGDT